MKLKGIVGFEIHDPTTRYVLATAKRGAIYGTITGLAIITILALSVLVNYGIEISRRMLGETPAIVLFKEDCRYESLRFSPKCLTPEDNLSILVRLIYLMAVTALSGTFFGASIGWVIFRIKIILRQSGV